MTDREAIDVLFNELKCIDRNDGIHCDRKCESCDLVMDVEIIRKAFNMAISALQAQDLQSTCNNLATDTISRQAAIDAINNIMPTKEGLYEPSEVLYELMQLPSAQPEIIRCKDCK